MPCRYIHLSLLYNRTELGTQYTPLTANDQSAHCFRSWLCVSNAALSENEDGIYFCEEGPVTLHCLVHYTHRHTHTALAHPSL